MTEVITDFHCKTCKKYYSSYQSLWIHNKKFHTSHCWVIKGVSSVSNGTSTVVNDTSVVKDMKYSCKFCNRLFNDCSNKCKHEKILIIMIIINQ